MCNCANDIKSWILKYGQSKESAIPLLREVQAKYGYLPRQALEFIIANTEISGEQLYGVATFYSQFRLKPSGKYKIKVCDGTACHVKGSTNIYDSIATKLKLGPNLHTSSDMLFTLETVSCLGACGLAPAVVISEEVCGQATKDKINKKIDAILKEESASE